MNARYLRGVSMLGYGVTLSVGIGVPIPILSEEILEHTLVTDADILAPVIDYSTTYPNRQGEVLAEVSYAELKSGQIKVKGKNIPTASLSSYPRALEIAQILKKWIEKGDFLLTERVAPLPGAESGVTFKPLNERR
jgi:L-aspartate semialdehyde sulfurtransferase